MKIDIKGYEGEFPEIFRDYLATGIERARRDSKISTLVNSVIVNFGIPVIDQNNSNLPKMQSHVDETIGIEALIKFPNQNADLLRIPTVLAEKLDLATKRFHVKEIVYEDWGLSKIDPFPRMTLNFSGPPGTGKTLAAHYVAKKLGKKIIEVSYADVVSKYFGQAAKNLSKLFDYAFTHDALLFVDEAETLLSKRSGGGSEAADHAVNSMRSQLLILIERTPIVTIFASNLIESYDEAFLSRIITLRFNLPNQESRRDIWAAHLPESLPLSDNVNPEQLAAQFDEINGREIARAVIEAAHKSAIEGRRLITLEDVIWGVSFAKGEIH